jgi:type VI secretion system protein ImpH
MLLACFGLTGPAGVLPHPFTALLTRRAKEFKDFSFRDFLDVFNHRAASLFYRAWQKYRLPAAYEHARLDPSAGVDPVTQALYCLVGLGAEGLRRRQQVDDEAFVYYGGHFARRQRPAAALEDVLEDYFGVPMAAEQFRGRWLLLERDDCSRLAGPGGGLGLNCTLGEDVIVGERVWDAQSMFRLRVGPLRYADFRRLLPDGDGLRPLCELARFYVGPEFSFDVQAVLAAGEAPGCRLSAEDCDGGRLGWDSWVFAGEPAESSDAVFALEGV